jgi:hypothetical protein
LRLSRRLHQRRRALSQSKELVYTLRCQKEPQDRIEGGVSFAADDNVVDNLGILGDIRHAAQLDFASL